MEAYLRRFLQPPSFTFNSADLGPFVFKEGSFTARRQEIKINSIPCSLYQVNINNPTVLYIHTYNSHRLEVQPLLRHLVRQGFNVASIELQRVIVREEKQVSYNKKEGIITFGFYQYEQLRPIIQAIRKKIKNQQIILWGRSMGAACAILYQAKYKDCTHLVLDSPFHNIQDLMATKLNQITSFPNFFAKKGVSIAKGSLNQILHFDISTFQLDQTIQKVQCALTFVYNPQDSVSNKSTLILYEKCKSTKKQIFYTEAEHDECRQQEVIQNICSGLNVRLSKGNKKLLLPKNFDNVLQAKNRSISKEHYLKQMSSPHIIKQQKQFESPIKRSSSRKLIKLGGSSPKLHPSMELESSINKSTRNSVMLSDLEGKIFPLLQ